MHGLMSIKSTRICDVSGFRRSVLDVFAYLGCYAALLGRCLPTFPDSLSVPSSKGQKMTPEDGKDKLSRNVGKELSSKAS
jgi:hypothetical protein